MRDAIATLTSDENNAFKDARFTLDAEKNTYLCQGTWSTLHLKDLSQGFEPQAPTTPQKITISGEHLDALDSAGALLLLDCIHALQEKHNEITLIHFTEGQRELLTLIQSKQSEANAEKKITPPPKKEDFLEMLGRETIHKIHQCDGLVRLVGDLTDKLFIAFRHWDRFQLPSIISNISSAGLKALPIIALLSFLIGVVLAYQMGVQLQTYGATGFIAYISGMAIFREFAPLITAIIVAGRTSSAFTAQIGSMKVNEEIDALYTMGLSPTELLVLPKVLGLLFILPFVIFWADVFSILGAMIMSKGMLHVGYYEFLTRLQTDVGADQLMLGLYKAPAFALLIALVGCFQGFQVKTNANSIGSQTTKSVVQALFLIIITDAIYSIIYQWMDL
ncbi:MAG: ABC transporter permease [Gammaproteobacteria bacterium]|nr:ABC transporter permease [Gammaproteobacteria bacterium]